MAWRSKRPLSLLKRFEHLRLWHGSNITRVHQCRFNAALAPPSEHGAPHTQSLLSSDANSGSADFKITLRDCPFQIFIRPSDKLAPSSLEPFTSPSTKVELEHLPKEILRLIESVYPPAIKIPIHETWEEPVYTLPEYKGQDYPPSPATPAVWSSDSKEVEHELLIMEKYFLDLWKWMKKFDDHYIFDLPVKKSIQNRDIGVPGLGEENFYLRQKERSLFSHVVYSKTVRDYWIIGPRFIPIVGTSLLVGLNWPYDVFRWPEIFIKKKQKKVS